MRREIVSEAQTYGDVCDMVWIEYIKLVPLSRDRVELIARERRSSEHRRLFATNDAWSLHNQALGRGWPGVSC